MSRNNSVLPVVVFFLSACTQSPAVVELKGSQSFTRSGGQNYVVTNTYNAAPSIVVSQNTEQRAEVSSIGISDLSPPSSTAKNEPAQIQAEKMGGLAPAAGGLSAPHINDNIKTTVNPWTNKPRSDTGILQTPYVQEARIDTSGEKIITIKSDAEVKAEMAKELPKLVEKEEKAEIKADLKEEIKREEEQQKHSLKIVDKKTTEKKVEDKKVDNKKDNKTKSSADFKWPVASKKILSSFGSKGTGKANDGINIAAKDGSPVWAVADGEVVYVSNEMRGFGNMVFIKHKDGRTTSYAHLGKISVDKYDRVKQGDVIGYIGLTGDVQTPQLFFSMHKGKEALDPKKNLSSDFAGL